MYAYSLSSLSLSLTLGPAWGKDNIADVYSDWLDKSWIDRAEGIDRASAILTHDI